MNAKLLFGALLIVSALLIVPAMATSQEVRVFTPGTGIAPSFSITIAAGEISMPLLVIGDNQVVGPAISTTSNVPWTLSVRDSMKPVTIPKIVGSGGKMESALGGTGYTAASVVLTNAMQAKTNGGSFLSLTASDQIIHSGTPGTFSSPVTLNQNVVPADPVLGSTSYYEINLMITGAAVP
jgi:hypothetical protein